MDANDFYLLPRSSFELSMADQAVQDALILEFGYEAGTRLMERHVYYWMSSRSMGVHIFQAAQLNPEQIGVVLGRKDDIPPFCLRGGFWTVPISNHLE